MIDWLIDSMIDTTGCFFSLVPKSFFLITEIVCSNFLKALKTLSQSRMGVEPVKYFNPSTQKLLFGTSKKHPVETENQCVSVFAD